MLSALLSSGSYQSVALPVGTAGSWRSRCLSPRKGGAWGTRSFVPFLLHLGTAATVCRGALVVSWPFSWCGPRFLAEVVPLTMVLHNGGP